MGPAKLNWPVPVTTKVNKKHSEKAVWIDVLSVSNGARKEGKLEG